MNSPVGLIARRDYALASFFYKLFFWINLKTLNQYYTSALAAPERTLHKTNIAADTGMNDKNQKLMAPREITRKGVEKIADITRAGAEILLEEGFISLTKRRVATRLGIAHGNVGYYFPTRESLWRAVVDYEFKRFFKKHQSNFESDPDDAQSCFDEYLIRWIDEYEDREANTFFAHIIAYAEVNPAVAKLRDEIYEGIFARIMERVRALITDVDDEELERRGLTVFLLMEGLHGVSAFRPALLKRNNPFRQHLLDKANAIVRGA